MLHPSDFISNKSSPLLLSRLSTPQIMSLFPRRKISSSMRLPTAVLISSASLELGLRNQCLPEGKELELQELSPHTSCSSSLPASGDLRLSDSILRSGFGHLASGHLWVLLFLIITSQTFPQNMCPRPAELYAEAVCVAGILKSTHSFLFYMLSFWDLSSISSTGPVLASYFKL